MEKIIGVLGNITENEMEIAIKAIEKSRGEKARIAKIKELERTIRESIKEIHSLNGTVFINGGGYVPTQTRIDSHPNAYIDVAYH